MGSFLDLSSRIALTGGIANDMLLAAVGLVGVLAVLAGAFSFFRAMLLGDGREPYLWFLQLLLVVALLAGYERVFGTIIDASQGLTDFLAEKAGWSSYWDTVVGRFDQLFAPGATSAWDRLTGLLQGGVLSYVLVLTYYLQFMAFIGIGHVTALFASLLHILGPLLIAGGIFARGASIRTWFRALLQVAFWPTIPPLVMLVTVKGTEFAVQAKTDNTAFIVGQNIVLTVLTLATPAVVAFLFGSAGVTALAANVASFATGVAMSGTREIASRFRHHGGLPVPESVATVAVAASGAGPASPSTASTPRPGDAEPNLVAPAYAARPVAQPAAAEVRGQRPGDGDVRTTPPTTAL